MVSHYFCLSLAFLSLSCVQWPSDLEKLKLCSLNLTFMVALILMGYCPFFSKTANIIALKIATILSKLVSLASFPAV